MNIHREILEFLLENIFNINVNIINFLKREYGNITVNAAYDIINDMIVEGYLKNISGMDTMMVGNPQTTLIKNFPLSVVVELKITSKGVKQLRELQLVDSSIQTNNSVRVINNRQRNIFIATLAVALIGAIGQWSSCFKKHDRHLQQPQEISKPTILLPSQLPQGSRANPSRPLLKASDSVKKK